MGWAFQFRGNRSGTRQGKPSRALFRKVWNEWNGTLCVDGDALYALSEPPEFGARHGLTMITPHEGEAAVLLARTRDQVGAARLRSAVELSALFGAILLKGPGSLVSDGSRIGIMPFVVPGLSVPGSGDVLAGIIGAFSAAGLGTFEAIAAGAYVHGLAGKMLQNRKGFDGIIAREIANAVPFAISRLRSRKEQGETLQMNGPEDPACPFEEECYLFISRSPEETRLLGAELARFSFPGLTICLTGKLGTGKTELVRGFAAALGWDNTRSPSFTIINEYKTELRSHTLTFTGWRNHRAMNFTGGILEDGFIVIVEWADRLGLCQDHGSWSIALSCSWVSLTRDPTELTVRMIELSCSGEDACKALNEFAGNTLLKLKRVGA